MINFGDVKKDDGQILLPPGDYVLKFAKWSYEEPQGKSPFIAVTLVNEDGAFIPKFYVSDKTQENTLINIKHLCTKVMSDEEFNKVQANDFKELAQKLETLTKGKEVHILASGEYYNGTLRAKLGFRPFAENAADPSKFKLKFDEKAHIKKEEQPNLPGATAGTPPAITPPGTTQLPAVDDLNFKE